MAEAGAPIDPPAGGDRPEPGPPVRRPPGWRRRRLRRAMGLLAIAAVVAAAGGWIAWRLSRPAIHRPGEEMAEITTRLSRDLPADAPTPRFTDVTAAAGLADFVPFRGERTSQLPEDMGSGAAWGDYDNDGDDDLFLVAAGGSLTLPLAERAASRLFENLGDGTFRPAAGFEPLRIQGMGAAWGDYDGDGWLDLALSGYQALRLFHNEHGRLVPVDAIPDRPGYWAGLAWGDYDGDRDLDLYVCGYVRYEPSAGAGQRASEQYGAAVPFTLNPASFEPEPNLLFENQGDGRFVEVAPLLGVSNPSGRSLSALWHDFDGDGRLDLYVANDISDNALFLNRGDTFEDAGLAALVADYRGAMGLAAGDWNRDGDDDLFVTHWLAQENALYDSRLADMARRAAAATAGGTPRIPLTFSDLASPLGLGQIALQMVGWGTEFLDFDGDGWLDLVVANGSTLETDEQPKRLRAQRSMLLWNRRGEHFFDLAPLAPELFAPHVSRGLAVSDYDRDGDLDILLVHLDTGVELLRNDMQSGHWLELTLRSLGRDGQPRGRGDGSQVVVHAGGAELRRAVTGASYLSQSGRTLHFGLGAATAVDGVEVRWLGGATQTFGPLTADAAWELTEGEPQPRRLGEAPGGATASLQPPPVALAALPQDERQRRLAFWEKQRAAMDAMKREGDVKRAEALFREALALDPAHQDSRYYLANCLAAEGRFDEALAELDTLRRANPMSHRAFKQWGVLRAMTAQGDADLAAAQASLERALAINQEESGSLLVLGEIDLLRGQPGEARRRLELACRSNPKAVSGFFLRAYLAWKAGDDEASRELLATAVAARGKDFKPAGAVAEGDVAARMHRETSPLAVFWESWDGALDPLASIFAPLDARLSAPRAAAG